MKHIVGLLLFLLFAPLAWANNGEVISHSTIHSLSKDEVKELWKKNKVPEMLAEINNGIDVIELEYSSTMPDGRPINASGVVFVPRGYTGKTKPTMVIYHHGTDMVRDRKRDLKGEQMICMAFAADGYIVLMPDYFGLGKSLEMHPYQHAETEAQSSIDMIRAVRKLKESLKTDWEEKIFITGYSQGGHAAMSTHKFISDRHKDEFRVWASAPMSGAYDMTGAQKEMMYQEYSHPGYLPYIIFGYNPIYKFFDNPADILKAPYDSILPPLFDGTYDMGKVNKSMPPVPKDIFKEEALKAFEENAEFPFRKALEQNNVHKWKAEEPVMLCYCKSDEQVHYTNAFVARNAMKKEGSKKVTVRSGGNKLDHGTCAIFTSFYTKLWFDSFRNGSKNGNRGKLGKRIILQVGKGQITKPKKK